MEFDEKKAYMEMPGICLFWKDRNSMYIEGNRTATKLFGFDCPEKIIGKYDCDLPCDIANYADVFITIDNRVMREDKQCRMIEVYPLIDKVRALFVSKAPLKDADNSIMGVSCCAMLLESYEFLKLVSGLSQQDQYYTSLNFGSYVLESTQSQFSLTTRESEVLFYFLRRKTAKQIAQLLKLSPRTVEDYIDHIKLKLDCHNKSELIQKALNEGLLYFIPCSLMNKNLSQFLLD
jgi:DNA-binding CsgD family transcriptional regulator